MMAASGSASATAGMTMWLQDVADNVEAEP